MHEPSAWLDRFFASYYATRPVNATFIGVHEHDQRLPDFSENGSADTLAEMAGLLEASEGAGPDSLGPVDWLDVRLARGFLRLQIWEYQSEHFQRGNPCTYTGEAAFGLLSLFLSDFAPLAERIEAAVARLAAMPRLLGQARTQLREAPRPWTERAARECTGLLAFLGDGVELLASENANPQDAFKVEAARAASAVADFRRYLEAELATRHRDRYACGEEALALYLRDGHFLPDSAEDIVRYAEAELDRAAAAPSAPARPASAEGASDDRGARYRQIWDQARAAAEAQQLVTWPSLPIRYRELPAWARSAAPYLYFLPYRSPAAVARPPVHDYWVAPAPAADDDTTIRLNHVIHHGGLGHHVQNASAFKAASRIGRIAAVDCASRIAMFCGGTMAEGWACYATDLMGEVGFLTPGEQEAERRTRMRMCARAVADVRLHQGRWTLDETAGFYQRRAGMPPAAALGEAVKNSMFPGAALMYVMGTDAIHGLRRELAGRDRDRFSLRGFHDAFLSHGSVPVSLIAEAMRSGQTC